MRKCSINTNNRNIKPSSRPNYSTLVVWHRFTTQSPTTQMIIRQTIHQTQSLNVKSHALLTK